ncbi:unnamed protein product [Rotaria socialis]|uniref:Uncharacterized protein n=1 Tax=Rotaria socialis TaxID=392032 RepID=A0A820VNJ2_9BILA|nr:unnamed protein product [Rotaria socialis]CAF3458003.1 unnamed protein product [Rotaria socialis]CAF3654366.1 unnamed protein product [Rotaria socialis]CAF4305102.1 unnamed protein product [Rotaria socialis]CAF4504522.1 unnamed protein product [Rotaria socialis]
MQSCTIETCLIQCRNAYFQCQTNPPVEHVSAQCLPSVSPLYNCQCDCCISSSTTCIPSFVGYSTTYQCQPSACGVSCSAQYPLQCVRNQNGRISGTCTGSITTTTSTTTISRATNAPGSTLTCSCMCCQSGSNCLPNIDVGIATISQCSSVTCTQACQNQYVALCPSLIYLGQTNGSCITQNSGNTRCQCQCCTTNGCPTSTINTNGDCASCYTLCQRQSPCGSAKPVAYSCTKNKSKISAGFSLPMIILISIMLLL